MNEEAWQRIKALAEAIIAEVNDINDTNDQVGMVCERCGTAMRVDTATYTCATCGRIGARANTRCIDG